MSSWKTYKNTEYGFSFKYPANLRINPTQERIDFIDTTVSARTTTGLTSNPTILRIDKVQSAEFSRDYNKTYTLYMATLVNVKVSGLINGVKINAEAGPGYGEGLPQVFALMRNKQNSVVIYFFDEEESLFNQILSTFKFLDQEEAITSTEKQMIDAWILTNNLNQYGDSKDMLYIGGTPLFNEETGIKIDYYEYMLGKYPDKPWNK